MSQAVLHSLPLTAVGHGRAAAGADAAMAPEDDYAAGHSDCTDEDMPALVSADMVEPPVAWVFEPSTGRNMALRSAPYYDAPVTGHDLLPGEEFYVDRARGSMDGQMLLHLADDRGWAFDKLPSGVQLCRRSE